MPKKSRKAKVRASQRAINTGYGTPVPRTVQPGDDQFTRPVAAPVASAPTYSRPVPAAARGSAPIVTDYGYVFRDLRRIAVLAAIFFVIMFVLYFLIEIQHIPIIPGIV